MGNRFYLLFGLLLMFVGVGLGAFGAHALQELVSPRFLETWQTAIEYHFYHALGLIALGIYYKGKKISRCGGIAGWLFIIGIVLFSGSLYLLVMTGETRLGMITPLGGLSLMAGWLCWFVAVLKTN